jgi:hypothetical protein
VSVDSTVLGHVFNRGSIIGAIDGVNMYSGVVANKGTISAGHQGCSTLSIEFPVEERIGSGESGSISILTEC